MGTMPGGPPQQSRSLTASIVEAKSERLRCMHPDGTHDATAFYRRTLQGIVDHGSEQDCRITLKDGRVLYGQLIFIDYLMNILLYNALEEFAFQLSEPRQVRVRQLEQVFVLHSDIARFEVSKTVINQSLEAACRNHPVTFKSGFKQTQRNDTLKLYSFGALYKEAPLPF